MDSRRIGGCAMRLFGTGCLWLAAVLPVTAAALTAGWTERARIAEAALELTAKLDSGAEHSALHVKDLAVWSDGGARHARFAVTDSAGRRTVVERPVVREALIKRLGAPPQRRPVVRLHLCIGHVQREAEVSLVDRSGFDFPLLLGRSFLRGLVLIDVDRQYLTEPVCLYPG